MVFNNDKRFFLTLDAEAAPAKIDLPTETIEPEESQEPAKAPLAPTLLVAPSDQAGTASAPAAPAPAPVVAAVSSEIPAVQGNQTAAAQASVPKSTESKSKEPVTPSNNSGLTTAEAIAAELAAAEADRPEMTYSTYAPDNLVPGAALSQRKRSPGAAVKNFRNMAEDLFKS
ncbi:MAG: hypothetical protein CL864_03190 [Cyanobium sp. SAT1300]|nr:hypothetical protein [Cyanobium sp. SAT1300]|tara:strand:+ start:5975 stop:6490 length:516 start_codon:yes stop_codon:yes gene_type:complete